MAQKKKLSYIPWLYRNMRQRSGLILLQITLNIVIACIDVTFALSTRNVIDTAVSADVHQFANAVIFLVVLTLTRIALSTVNKYVSSTLNGLLNWDFKRSILHKILQCDYNEISRYHSGDLIQRMNVESRNAYGSVLGIIGTISTTITAMVAAVAALFQMSPEFTMVIGIAGVLYALFSLLTRGFVKQLHKEAGAMGGKVSGFFHESISKLFMVQALDVSPEMERRADDVMRERWAVQCRNRNWGVFRSVGSSLIISACSTVTLIWCAYKLLSGDISYGELTAMTTLVSRVRGSVMNLPSLIPQTTMISASCERLMEIEEIADQPVPDVAAVRSLYDGMTGISVKDLTFSYDRDPVMKDVTLTIPKGGLTVIVGPSGIGKSTLLKLLLGLYRPDSGELCIDTDGGAVPVTRSTRPLFCYAPQGNFLLSGTLRENLVLTNPQATDEQIRHALYVSAMDEYVASLPEGLETPLRENGSGLSEGQSQRLSLARAIISGAPVLLLDEVTSALDAATEQTVLERICALPDKTCIAVTHRPAALRMADWIIDVTENSMTLTKA